MIKNNTSNIYILKQMIKIYIKTMGGEVYTLHMRKSNTIIDVKKNLLKNYDIPFENILLYKEQNEVSKIYERLPKPHAIDVEEWINDNIYHRKTEDPKL